MPVERPQEDTQREKVAQVVLSQVRAAMPQKPEGEISQDVPLAELGLDSLTQMDVVNRIEGALGIRFREEWLYDIDTGGDLIDCVVAVLSGKQPPAAEEHRRESSAEPAAHPAEGDVPPEHYDVALFPECVAFRQRIEMAAAVGLAVPFFRVSQGVHGPLATIEGREVVSFTSFDYVGMARHPEVAACAKQAIDRFGTSASASRLVGGDNTILRDLDEELARFLGTEAALVFPSGYGTNASLFGHLFGENDLILYDELAHNSIVQGTNLSSAAHRAFPHNDHAFLDQLLADVRPRHRRVVVAIEGVYSMDGDFPDLRKFVEVKRRHHALLYVDEAHSVGVMGATGRGLCEHYGIDPSEGDLWMGTISKALGSCGGYLAGRRALLDYLKYTTPSFVFATACSPANAAAALAALRQLRAEPQRLGRLHDRAQQFLDLAKQRGLNTGNAGGTPIVPVILGDSQKCIRLSHELLRRGIHVQPILYPAVRESAARLRFFITSEHTEEQIARTVATLAELV